MLFLSRKKLTQRVSASRFTPEPLESRLLCSATPSDYDQYMLELINYARANPAAEASKLGIDPNEGLTPGTIPSTAVQPLAWNPNLIQSAQSYTQALLAAYAYFGYDLNSSTPQTRMAAAGYAFSGNYSSNENIYAYTHGTDHAFPISVGTTAQQFDGLFVDAGVSGRGNRTNLLDPTWKEVGVSVGSSHSYTGTDTSPDHTPMNAILTTQDFAYSDSDPLPFLTGVAFTDKLNTNFYAPGEGLGGLTITATRVSDSMVFTTTTYSSGGYSLAVPAGTYNIVASGAGLANPISQNGVVVSNQNVEADFIQASKGVLSASFAAPLAATPVVVGQKCNVSEKLAFTNIGNAVLSDQVSVTYFLSASGVVDSSAVALPGAGHAGLHLAVGKQALLNVRLTSIPAGVAAGNDYLIARITDASGMKDVVTANTLTIQPAQIDLAGTFVSASATVKNGKAAVITINVTNNGNVPAIGSLPVKIGLSTTGPNDPSPLALPLLAHPLNLKPGKSIKLVLHSVISGISDGSYYVLVTLDPANSFHDINLSNNVFASTTPVVTVTG